MGCEGYRLSRRNGRVNGCKGPLLVTMRIFPEVTTEEGCSARSPTHCRQQADQTRSDVRSIRLQILIQFFSLCSSFFVCSNFYFVFVLLFFLFQVVLLILFSSFLFF